VYPFVLQNTNTCNRLHYLFQYLYIYFYIRLKVCLHLHRHVLKDVFRKELSLYITSIFSTIFGVL
jgi:hypothetical protein